MLPQPPAFASLKRRTIEASFSGGHITSDAGLLLLRQIDKKRALSQRLAHCLSDPRDPTRVHHHQHRLIQQRLFALCAGYEDLNDHQLLRHDYALQTATDQTQTLASVATLHRMEARVNRETIVRAHHLLWQHFVESHKRPPKQVILDFDATDVPLHGDQLEKFFHGYYDHYCYLPLYVFAGRFPLVAYLRHSKQDGATHTAAILRLLVFFLRKHWPNVQIIFRGDSGFCRQPVLRFCERYQVDYIVGLARNTRLQHQVEEPMRIVEELHDIRRSLGKTGCTKEFFRIAYAAKSWNRKRQVIAKLEVSDKGRNPRFLVTTLKQSAAEQYQQVYCARGDMENRIKDQQLDLFAKRTSSKHWWSNQWRMLLSMFGFTLFEALRAELKDPQFKRMSVNNLRLKLIKIGAVITRNTRRIRFYLSEAYVYKDIFQQVARSLAQA